MIRRVLTLLIALCIALILYNYLPLQAIRRTRMEHGYSLLILLVAFSSIRLRLSKRNISLATETDQSNIVDSFHDKAYEAELMQSSFTAFNRVLSQHSFDEFDQLIDTMLDPGSVVIRINETAELGTHDYGSTIERVAVKPESYKATQLLLPVLTPRKGELVDNYRLLVDGKPARTLTRRETTGAVMAVTATVFATAFQGREQLPLNLWQTLQHQILYAPADCDQESIIAELRSEYEEDNNSCTEGALIARAGLWSLAADICTTYMIIAVVPITSQSATVEISYSRRREPLLLPTGHEKAPLPFRPFMWLSIQLQLLFGLIRRSERYELHHSTDAQSYHFRATVPEGLYVYDLGGSWMDDTRGRVRGLFGGLPLRPVRPEWKISDTRGLEHVHAYGRDLDVWSKLDATGEEVQASERTAAIRFELREKPPGLLFVVGLISLFLAVLVLAAARWHDLIFVPAPGSGRAATNGPIGAGAGSRISFGSQAAPWPVIIFGVPAIISGWIVSRFTPDNVKLLSISTIAVAGWSLFNTALAVAVSAFSMSVPARIWRFPMLGYFEPLWALLVISTLACFAMSTILLLLRVRRYGRRVRRLADPLTANGSAKKK
jgi:hypothetical protein